MNDTEQESARPTTPSDPGMQSSADDASGALDAHASADSRPAEATATDVAPSMPPAQATDEPADAPLKARPAQGPSERGRRESLSPHSKWATARGTKAAPKRKRRVLRWLGASALVGVVGTVALWIAVHRVPWLGPLLANTLRSVIGVEAVARLEDFAYGIQDRWNRMWRSSEKPKAYWEVPDKRAAAPEPVAEQAGDCEVPPFRPDDVGPAVESFSAPGDGVWVPIADPQHPDDAPRMYKTLLHPDARRSWSAVSVVAVDLRQVDLHAVAGWDEPKSATLEARKYERKALIPQEAHGELLAAFNGGFRAEHGNYGMRIDSVTLLPARRLACVIVQHPDDRVTVGNWDELAEGVADGALWWRQTPQCMVTKGELHPGLRGEKNTYWGATLDGDTIIRRSAIGLSSNGKVLYVGIGDFTSARTIAAGMKHAGAVDVAQLDVNWSYPRFVLYQPREAGSKELLATALCPGFEFSEDEYVRQRADRDFFYLTRKPTDRIEKAVCGDGEG